MPILQYETRVSSDGNIALPPIPEYRDRKVIVRVHEEKDEIWGAILECSEGNDKTPEQDFFDFCEELDQTPEEWQAAVDDFMTSWKGCLKGVPHMTAKEIRAERLEKKYGQRGGEE